MRIRVDGYDTGKLHIDTSDYAELDELTFIFHILRLSTPIRSQRECLPTNLHLARTKRCLEACSMGESMLLHVAWQWNFWHSGSSPRQVRMFAFPASPLKA